MLDLWLPILNYIPKVSFLAKGWLSFHFKTQRDASRILGGLWLCGRGNLILKKWHLNFDLDTECILMKNIWILLPNFPLALWNRRAFEAVGNTLGKFLFVDEETLMGCDKRVGKLLVHIDISHGLLEEFEIEWQGRSIIQTLDFWKIPFWYLNCKKVGHLKDSCPFGISLDVEEGSEDDSKVSSP